MRRKEAMISINEFLDSILDDFTEYVNSGEKLCVLKDTHFDGGRIPDYTDFHIQQLYLLRYAYAYAFEYKTMYKELLQRLDFYNNIKVTSIGCGSLIDYWSLSRVFGENCTICYRGIDAVDWIYKFPKREFDDVTCSIGNVLDFFRDSDTFSSDVYIFPKSISEFSNEEVSALANCFTQTNIFKESVHFMFSLRTDDQSRRFDIEKTSILFNHLAQCGFHTQDKCKTYVHFKESIRGKKIREVDDDFSHPSKVIDCLKELYTKCNYYHCCKKKDDCMARLSRWPILKCNQAAWQIFTFKR